MLATGGVHLYEYTSDSYSSIPTIGPLFLLNAIGAGVIAIGLLVAGDRLVSVLLALAGAGLAGGALVALLVSESRPLFGFMETGYRTVVVVAIIVEALAVVALGAYVVRAPRGRSAPVSAAR